MKLLKSLLLFLGLVSLAGRADASTLYASTAAGGTGELYILNQFTGAVIQDIGPLNDVTGLNYPITGLAFSSSGQLYGSTGNSAAATQARLVKINPATAQVTLVGSFNAGPVNGSNVPTTMGDIGFDSAGKLYGVATIGGPDLYSINLVTGQATVVGPNGVSTSTGGGGVAVAPDGTIYSTPTSSRYGTYNSITGAYTNITNPTKPAGTGAYTALDFDGNVLYGLNTGPGSPPPTALVTINAAGGTVTLVGNSIASLDAIAFLVPEPTAVSMLLICATTAFAGRRRRLNAARF